MRITTPTRFTSAVRTTLASTSLPHQPLRSIMLLGLLAAAITILASTVASAESLKQLIASVGFGSGGGRVAQPKAALAPVPVNSSLTTAMQPSEMPTVARRAHSATLLADGRVIIIGGENGDGLISQSEIFDPAAGTFSVAGNLGSPRANHSATRLADGRLLIAGGRGPAGSLTTTEVFDPTTGNFASGPAMGVARAGHSATLFADGRVLIAGGDSNGSAELLDVTAGSTTAVGSMSSARMMHSAALLQDGRILIVGGRDAAGNELSSGEIFDTPSGSFSPVSSALVVSRVRPHLRVLFDGKVQIIGGSNDGSMEIYDPLYEGFGAYAHVLPESDTCAGLPAQILGSQTRAALFHNGQTDTLLDRTGHTITELNGQALVVGGVNSSGAVLDSSSVLSSSSSSLTTDKMDYAPGEIATITGRGFQAGETVRVKIHEDPHTPQERGFDATADADGNFTGEYLVQDYDLDMKFIVGARGLTSGATAQTTMTDSQPTAVTLTPNTQTVNPGNSGIYTVDVTMGGNATNCPMTLSAPFSAPAPVGVSTVLSGGATITTNANFSKTLTLTTTNTGPMAGRTQPGTYPFTLTVARGAGCQGSGNVTTSGTLIVASPNVAPVASSVTISGTPQYGQLLTGNYTYFDADGDAEGASTFRWLRNGATQVGTNQTYTAVAADVGQTLTFEVTPVAATGTSPGTAVQSASVTINKKSVTASVTAGNKTYDGNTTATITGCTLTGVLAGDTANVTCTAAGPNTFSNVNVGTGKTVTATNISLSGSASGNYVLSSTSATTTADITTRAITATLTATDKIYDGNIAEPDASMSCSLTGVLAGDSANVNCTATSGTFNSPNVATANQVTATVTISGTATSNYTLGAAGTATTSSSATATAHITPKTLTASIIGNPTKTYDGNTTATLAPANFSLTGLIGSESFAVTQTAGSYNSADVATATTVTASLSAGDFTPGAGTLASNYNLPTSASGAGQILKADAIITVTPFNGVYDGNAHGVVSSSATGVNSEALSGLVIDPGTYTNVPGGSIHWTFTNPNYNDQSGDVDVVINKADATVIVNGYSGTYDAAAHGATGTATGVGGADLSAGLSLGATFTDYPGGTANWTFTGGTNYNDQNGTAAIVINKADATVIVNGYSGTYDAAAHGASGTATGVGGVDLSAGLNLGATFTDYPGGTANWSFTGGTNYNDQNGTAAIVINKADATVIVNGYSGTYDAAAHGASGTATGVGGADLSAGLNLGATFTDYPGGTANWTFTGGTNYNDQNGTAAIVINKADATVIVNGYSGTYDAAAHGASGTATGVGGVDLSAGLNLGATFTDYPGGTANWSFTGGTNYNDQNGTAAIVINKADATVIVNGYSGTYDAAAHGASGTATGVGGADLSAGLNLGATFTDYPGGTANWTFTGGTNYNDQNGTAAIVINKADATVIVNGYSGTYDAAAHGASGTATGIGGVDLNAGLNLGATFTDYPGGTANWTFTGGTNYNDQNGTAAIAINKADATVIVNGYSGTYDAAAHGASGTATGVGGADLSAGLNLGATFTDYPGGTANWTFTGGTNYNDQNGTAAIVINKADATVIVNGYSGTYDAAAHGASGTATGVGGADLSAGLNLGATFTDYPGGTANWSFTGGTNYNDQNGTAAIVINKADAVIVVTPYNVTYDANAHTATGTATGVSGENLSGLNLGGTTHTNAGNFTDTWTFTDVTGNYNDTSGNVNDAIGKANATINVTSYSVTYDGAAHTATGTATGVLSESLSGLDLTATSHTNAGTYNGDAWTFTDVSGNYNDTSGTVNDSIGQASSSTTVICPASVTYSGSAQTPCTASATGAGSLNESLTVNHSNNTDAGTATASASFAGDANHTGSSDSKDFTINKRTLTGAIVGDPTKTYDGNTNATLSSANFLLGNLVAGQNITVIKTTGSYNSKDVITASLVSTTLVSGDFTAGMGTNFNNYNLPASASGSGHITPKTLAITAEDKSFLFGGTMPTLTAAYNAFAAGEGVGNLTGALVLTVKNASNVAVPFNASTPSGTYTIIPSGLTSTNYTITFNNGTLTIGSWTLLGFYQPVDMSTTAFILNTVKGGSTVPLKFNIYAGTPGPLTERKSITDVLFSSVQVAEYNCLQTPGYESPVDVSNTGSTSLRYDGTAAQFIQNWQTPKGANRCYQVRMTALDGSHLDAFFKTK